MKYYVVAGEASGDLHASNLMKSLKKVDPEADFRFFGGDLMQAVGGTLVKHYREMAFMGFLPVLLNLRTIFRNMDICKKDILVYRPDVVILVDYPGFNLKIARFVKTHPSIPVHYYISPKIWAWKKWRLKSIRQSVDKMLCILPFEVDFYKKNQYAVDYVGNPTVDAVAQRDHADENFDTFTRENRLDNRPIIALLAGSRKQEIKDNLPTMLEAASGFSDYQLVIAGAPGINPDYYQNYIGNHKTGIVFGQTYRLLQQAQAALVTSGTATLETALFRVPQTVCYQTPAKYFVSFVFEHLFTVPSISLVNLIAGKIVVKELFAKHFSRKAIQNELRALLQDENYRNRMLEGYDEVISILGQPGASMRAAEVIVSSLPCWQYYSK